ncbi:MAG: TonB-dependent receptor [Rubrivivax sp.]|nr:TonB-dependent receptor [Rubrivivax sp.]
MMAGVGCGAVHAQGAAPKPALSAASAASAPTGPAQQVLIEARPLTDAEQRRDSTLGMTVVGRDELDQHGDSSVLDVLQRLPGITLDGDTPRLRGMGGGYTLILLNGEPAPPGFSLDTLAPADIERIEVIKGPTAEQGGVAGTLNVILRGAPRLRQREARASLGYRALAPQGSASLRWGDRVGALGFQLPLTAYSWANAASGRAARVSRPEGGEPREDEVSSHDEWRGGGLNFSPRLEGKLSDTDTLQWQAFVQRNESRNHSRRATEVLSGPAVGTVTDASASRGNWQMQRTQAQWVRKTADGVRVELKASAQSTLARSAGQWVGRDAAGAFTAQRDSLSSQRERRYGQGGRLRLPLAGAHTLAAGWDLEASHRRELRRLLEDLGSGPVERLDGSIGLPFSADVQRATAFAQDEWSPDERGSVVAGLRAERVRTITAGRGEPVANVQHALSPLLHLRHAFDAKGRQALRASIARSIRVPDIGLLLPRYVLNGSYERDQPNTPLAADSAGNPRLQPERATALELAFETQLPGGGVASVGIFHRQIGQLVRRRTTLEAVAEASVPRWVSRPANIGRARSSGLELEVKGRARDLLAGWRAAGPALQLRAAVSVYRSAVEQIDDPDARLEGQPPWQATLGFDDKQVDGRLSYGAGLALTPAYTTQQTDNQRLWRGPTRRLDAFVAWRVDRQLQFRLAANNLVPADTRSFSSVADLDGFAASTASRRQTVAQVTANAVLGF